MAKKKPQGPFIKLWAVDHRLDPEAVRVWCSMNCGGYFKVVCYKPFTSSYKAGAVDDARYVDRIHFLEERDSVMARLVFELSVVEIKRDRVSERDMFEPRDLLSSPFFNWLENS